MNKTVQSVLIQSTGVALGVFIALFAFRLYSKPPAYKPRITAIETANVQSAAGLSPPFIITKNGCQACEGAKKWIANNRLPVTELVSDNDPVAANLTMKMLGATAYPTLVLNGTIVQGFAAETYEELLVRDK